jgi:hypothetical protein
VNYVGECFAGIAIAAVLVWMFYEPKKARKARKKKR